MPELFRKIIHVDMDAFFASVEQLDNPDLNGKPIVVGGRPESRGVVAAASYEARKYGIRSAMSSYKASQLCKEVVFIRPRITRYREISKEIHNVFQSFTSLIEPLSLDEAYLDVSNSQLHKGSATLIAKAIKKEIKIRTGLTASAGVSYNKFLAKLASDMDKPDGLFIIKPNEAVELIHQLPVKKLFGVGKVTANKMQSLNLYKVGDIETFGLELLRHHFGKQGDYYYNLSKGIDNREVNPVRKRKSIGRETTFLNDINDIEKITKSLFDLLGEVALLMEKHQVIAKTITLKVKYHDFVLITRSSTSTAAHADKKVMYENLILLLGKTLVGEKAVRLIGVSVSSLKNQDDEQNVKQKFLF